MAAAFAAMLPLAFAAPAQAAVVGDQAQPSGISLISYDSMAQMFIAGKTGRLDHVTLRIFTSYGTATVSIRQLGSDGNPGLTDIGNARAVSSGYVSGYHTFDFSKANVPITAGNKYVVLLNASNGYVSWYATRATPPITPTFLGGKLFVGMPWTSFSGDFVFSTFVNTSTMALPTIATDTAGSTANEGAAPTMTGTFSDPNGDAVTLAVTGGGAVTPTAGTGSGTWSWTESAADESGGQQVTVTVTNSHGLFASAQFPVTVKGVKPTVTITNDPPAVPEGTQLSLVGTANSPDSADNVAGFNYLWSVSKDNGTPTTTPGPSFNFTVADEGTYVVTLDATDDGGITGTSSFTVVGTEINPTARIDGVKPADAQFANSPLFAPQENLSFAGSFVDAATNDTHTASWNFGDGQSANGFGATHFYTAAGTYTVTLIVKDDDGAQGQATTTVVVLSPQQMLSRMESYINGLQGLNAGQKNSLNAKLNAASDSIGRGDTKAASNQLNAFLNELTAYQGSNKISGAAFNTLVTEAHEVQGSLGTFNRFLEWLPFLA